MPIRLLMRLCGVLVMASVPLAAQDPCSTLLAGGVFNTFSSSYANLTQEQFHHALCAGTIQSGASATSHDAALNLGALKFDLGLSYGDAQAFQSYYQQRFCSAQDSSSLTSTQLSVFQKLVSPILVQGYLDCVRARSRGLETSASASPDRRHVRFQLSYSRFVEGAPAPLLQRILVSPKDGATCDGNLSPNQAIKSNQYFIDCARASNAAVSISLVTEYGTVSYDLGSSPPPPSSTDLVLGALPSGTILLWFNRSGHLPTGWAICNGGNGTPDLRDRFLRGTGDFARIGSEGGSAIHHHEVTVSLPDSGRRGSDAQWGQTPWRNGPNPVMAGSTTGTADDRGNLPPYVEILVIMKL